MSGTRQWTEAQTDTWLSETLRKSTADGRANTMEELLKHGERDLHIWTFIPSLAHFVAAKLKTATSKPGRHIAPANVPDMLQTAQTFENATAVAPLA